LYVPELLLLLLPYFMMLHTRLTEVAPLLHSTL
jgi:hypothetical protein